MEKEDQVKKYTEDGEKAAEELLKVATLAPENGWEFHSEKEDVICHSTYDEKGLAKGRGEGVIDCPVDELIEYIRGFEYDKVVDSGFEAQEVVEEFTPTLRITWKQMPGKFCIVAARDFVSLGYVKKLEDGRTLVCAKSVDYPGKPPKGGVVRGEIFGGWVLTPDPAKPERTKAIYVATVDVKGSIPKMFIQGKIIHQAFNVLTYQQNLSKYREIRAKKTAAGK